MFTKYFNNIFICVHMSYKFKICINLDATFLFVITTRQGCVCTFLFLLVRYANIETIKLR